MKLSIFDQPEHFRHRRPLASLATQRRLAAAFLALIASLLTNPAIRAAELTAPADCSGPYITRLAGPHAVTHQSIADLAALKQRLPQLEASIRAVVARDPSLGPAVAEALFAAIRSGSAGIQEGMLRRDEKLIWMAYQPMPGQIEAIPSACLRLDRDYPAFAISVAIAAPEVPAPRPVCALTATRNCEARNPTIRVDLAGSSSGARVSLTTADRPPTPVGTGEGGQASGFDVADPGPYDLEALFTVKVPGPRATPRQARVFRFLMPKVCGNLAYLGEGPGQPMPGESQSPAGAGCERSVRVERCPRPTDSTDSTPPPPPARLPSASCEDDSWTARFFLFGLFPTGEDQQRDLRLASGPAHERFGLANGYGLGASLERRFGKVLGAEAAAHFGSADSEYQLESGAGSGKSNHRANFYALTAGVNFHLLECGGADLYIGPFLGYGGLADPNFWVLDHHFRASFDGRFLWGAQLGLDLPFRPEGAWGFHAGLRYFDLSQDTDAGSFAIDPLIAEGGLAYRF